AREPDGRGNQPVWLVGVLTGHHAVDDLAGANQLRALFLADLLAVRRKDGADGDEVRLLHAGVAKGELERRETVLVNAHPRREEDGFGHEHVVHHGKAALPYRNGRACAQPVAVPVAILFPHVARLPEGHVRFPVRYALAAASFLMEWEPELFFAAFAAPA